MGLRDRLARSARILAGAGGLGLALVACVDLFHSTELATLCDVDAAACAPDSGAAPAIDASTAADFCAWDHAAARASAVHACAWLGACVGPLGDDALGACLVRATLAYDCTANPNRPVRGAVRAFWDCAWHAKSCGDVRLCVEPSGAQGTCVASAFEYAACESAPNPNVRIACDAGQPSASPALGVESCAASGRTCVTTGTLATCAGSATACAPGAGGAACDGTRIRDCDPDGGALDQGVDCAGFGAGTCANGACLAVGDAGCAADAGVTCSGDTAVACPSGVRESVDCRAVLGVAGSCSAPGNGRAWDVARACTVGGGACPADSCAGSVAHGCAHGAPFDVDCAAQGLGPCRLVTLPGQSEARAACSPP